MNLETGPEILQKTWHATGRSSSSTEMIIEDAIQIFVRAGYLVQKRSEKEGG